MSDRNLEPPIKVKCLLVDDLEENLLALSALLRRDDVELLLARSGAEALDLLLTHDVALALLDVQMPEMDGIELAELMRGAERTRHVPLIFVTAGSHDQHRLFKGYDLGAVDFLYKPIEPRILRNKAEVFFQLYRQKQQLAHELRERTEDLRLNEMFMAVLGHDLRNPLNALLMTAHVLQLRANDEDVKKIAAKMEVSAKRMSRLIEDLLDVARVRFAGGLPLRRERMDFSELAARIVQEVSLGAPERRIESCSTGDCRGDWDAERLAQVVSNLVGNSIQHGDPGSPIEVTLAGHDERQVVLTVKNKGAIPSDVLPSLFDPFRRGQRSARRQEGLGLGLFIVQQIVEAHRGTIEVAPDAGATCFTVTLPRTQDEVVNFH